jgi:hypothetical protein
MHCRGGDAPTLLEDASCGGPVRNGRDRIQVIDLNSDSGTTELGHPLGRLLNRPGRSGQADTPLPLALLRPVHTTVAPASHNAMAMPRPGATRFGDNGGAPA